MRITKFTHACVRLERDGRVLVIDPGTWSEPGALLGADAVLITHEHVDHIDVLRLRGLGVPIYAPADAVIDGLAVTPVSAGESFTAAGFEVSAFGGRHAFIYDGKPDCANLCYLVDGVVYHPGDSLHRPGRPVETLLVPLHGSWLKTVEAIDFVREVKPERAFGIHEAQLNDRGLGAVNAWITEHGGTAYRFLAPRETA
jgi:L-ascorbate metabolism protein UlaG (beta-lactamase superfamily)